MSCPACRSATADTACDSCSKTRCCPTFQAFSDSADASAFNTCSGACSSEACVDECVTRFPVAGAAFRGARECQFASCGAECVCAAASQDTSCTACAKQRCCESYVTYNAAAGAAEFGACIAPCTTQACIDACGTSNPEAGAAYRTLSTCLTGNCRTECGG